MEAFTPTQGRYLSFIAAYMDGFGLAPAESEIADALRVSGPSANQMVKMLEKKSLIRRTPGVARSIELLIDRNKIPKWKGKTITRTVREWVFEHPKGDPVPTSKAQKGSGQTVYQFKITLVGSKPAIWRRIETLNMSLAELHEAIQSAMGWTNSHLHAFEVGGEQYADPLMMDDFGVPGEKSYAGITIEKLVHEHGPKFKFIYLYDFGDGWEQVILLEKTTSRQPDVQYPRCTGGARCCPPEDVGGIWGYADFLDAIQDPNDERHDELMEWSGGGFDPEEFDLAEINNSMKIGMPSF